MCVIREIGVSVSRDVGSNGKVGIFHLGHNRGSYRPRTSGSTLPLLGLKGVLRITLVYHVALDNFHFRVVL